MDILDMPMSMLFPSELSSTASSTPPSMSSTTSTTYPHGFLGVDSSQDELLLMHHHQQLLQLQQLQHHQRYQQHQQELQFEMAKVGLGTPPASPFQLAAPLKQEDAFNHDTILFNVLDTASSTSHYSHYSSYSHMDMQGYPCSSALSQTSASPSTHTSQAIAKDSTSTTSDSSIACTISARSEVKGDFFPPNQSTMYSPYSEISGINTNTCPRFSVSPPTIPLAMIKRETPSPTVSSVALTTTEDFPPLLDFRASTESTAQLMSISPYPSLGDCEGSQGSSPCSSSSSRAGSQECEPRYSPSSPLPSLLQDFPSTSTLTNSQSRPKARPKSMIITSTMSSPSLLSPSFSTQPYISPFHNDSLSTSMLQSAGSAVQQLHDRRRSSSGPYYGTSSAFITPVTYSTSRTQSADHMLHQYSHHSHHPDDDQMQNQLQYQQQRSQIQYHPQQQHFQHLLDPSMVPEITDIHVCPVCQRRFTRPFNLRSHIMTHTTARPYPCDECHWKFTRQHDLLRHKRAKHPGSVPPLPPKITKVKLES